MAILTTKTHISFIRERLILRKIYDSFTVQKPYDVSVSFLTSSPRIGSFWL